MNISGVLRKKKHDSGKDCGEERRSEKRIEADELSKELDECVCRAVKNMGELSERIVLRKKEKKW